MKTTGAISGAPAGTGGQPARTLRWELGPKVRSGLRKGAIFTGTAGAGGLAGAYLSRRASGTPSGSPSNGGPTGAGNGNPSDNAKEEASSDLGALLAGLPIGFGAAVFKGLGFNEQDAKTFGTLLAVAVALLVILWLIKRGK